MRLHDSRTDAGDLDAGIVLHEEARLQHEVHRHHAGTPAQHVLERVADPLQERRLLVLLPRRGRHHDLGNGTGIGKGCGNGLAQRGHIVVNEAAGVGGDEEVVFFRHDASHIVGGLHRAGHRRAHLHHALRHLLQTADQSRDSLFGNDRLPLLARLHTAGDARVGARILSLKRLVDVVQQLLHELGSPVVFGPNHHLARRCNRGVGFTDLNVSNFDIFFLADYFQDDFSLLHRAAASLVDIDAGVAAQSAGDADAVPLAVFGRRLPFHRNAVELQTGAGSPGGDGVVVLGVEVDDLAAFQELLAELRGTRHTVLLVGRGDDLQGGMHDAVIFEHGQCHRQPDAVVSAQ